MTSLPLKDGTSFSLRLDYRLDLLPYLVHFLEKRKAFLNAETYFAATGDPKYGNN
jgi:hypothetical protein